MSEKSIEAAGGFAIFVLIVTIGAFIEAYASEYTIWFLLFSFILWLAVEFRN